MIYKCQQCGKEFKGYPCKSRGTVPKYCLRGCYFRSRWGEESRKQQFKCLNCGKLLSAYKTKYGIRKFCNRHCSRLYNISTSWELKHDIPDDFGHWCAGFTDGEGSFLIAFNKRSNTYSPRFHLGLRADDADILYKMKDILGIGSTIRQKGSYDDRYGKTHNPQFFFAIGSIRACASLVSFFRKYPLRSKKSKDFEIWAKAIEEFNKPAPDIKKIKALKQTLETSRKYSQ